MKIKFNSIYIRNFLSIGEAKIDLDNLGYCLIKGINNNKIDSSTSNGSGKSSIFEAVSYCLTGETIRQVKDVENLYTTGGTMVELDLDIDKDKYIIARYKNDDKYGTNLKVYINGEDKSGKGIRDTQKLLEDYLPDINSMFLGSVIILGQGLPQRLTNNTPSGRKEILEKLSKSDFMIQDIKNKLDKRQSELKLELRELEDKILQHESSLTIFNNDLQFNNRKLEELKNENIEQYQKDIIELTNTQKSLTQNITELNNIISDKEKELENAREEYTTFIEQYNNKKNQIENKYKESLNRIELDIKGRELEKSSIQKEINTRENVKDVCPMCGQKLPHIHKLDTTDLHIELQSKIKNINDLNTLLDSVYIDKEKELKTFSNNYDTIKEEITNKGKIIKEELNKFKSDLKDNLKTKDEIYDKINTYNVKINTLQSQINETQQKISELNKKIVDISQEKLYNINKKDTVSQHLDVNSKMNTLVSRDFRGYLLSNVIEYIDRKAKEYSMLIFNTDKVEFRLDGNNIYIGYNGKQYEALSGGERQKIDLIIQFSIRDMLVEYTDFHCNILALDEIFDNLDSYGCQKVIDTISNKLNDISSIFIITHHTDDLQIPSDITIEVVKDENGVSSIYER